MKQYHGYYVTIGLEIHVALKTTYKLFSQTPNEFKITDFSLFDIGMPGVLPNIQKEPVEMASAFALSVQADLKKYSEFERKHYFYPDLPLGYQITQQHQPILIGGKVPIFIDGEKKLISIEHAHLECDAAKSLHNMYSEYTAIDISRCSSSLLEIVSDPCMHSPEEAKSYAKEVFSLVTFLNICDGKMEEGSFRVDASISLSKNPNVLGTRVEIKNISSFHFLEQALFYEIDRQAECLNHNIPIQRETRLFHEESLSTQSMRSKETLDEYRFMKDPDILPLIIDDAWIQNISQIYPVQYFEYKHLLKEKIANFHLDIPSDIIDFSFQMYKNIWLSIIKQNYFTEKLMKLLLFWLVDIQSKIDSHKTLSLHEVLILEKSSLEAKEIKESLIQWFHSSKNIEDCMPIFVDENHLSSLINPILKQYPEQILKYKNGEQKILQFLIGKVLSQLKGKAPATKIKELVENLIHSL